MNGNRRLDILMKKYRENTIAREEFDELIIYMEDPRWAQDVREWMEEREEDMSEVNNHTEEERKASEARFRKVLDRMKEEGKVAYPFRKEPARKERKGWHHIAAVIVVLFASATALYYGNFFDNPASVRQIEERVGTGEKATVTLTDGTVVRLNSGSTLKFPEKFSGNKREVTLEGEAFFEVTRNEKKPFLVKTADLTTRVLGTSFNIKAYREEGEIAVSVATGKVQVVQSSTEAENNGEAVSQIILVPNEQVVYRPADQSLEKKEIDAAAITAWKDGVLYFKETPLGEVVKTLERWYGVEIRINNPELAECQVWGKHKKETLLNVLKAYEYSLGITYKVHPDGSVDIDGEKCK
ncbi:DUF4974 domain-containing protein [Sinomicrobium pectinilyticum]|uniref:DUF4974 domain-containing protein n=1 Tax=Sinomicrobium pectinilyticum TaxID=1084421 RepID=A0A3N0EJ23_SINP1|nr:FecR domain-containing protein [Sinomicrobium pectinilyticum]RNL87898.1 DUF4974 domain-containing protein [Sinomicrobium pectinilyticum]